MATTQRGIYYLTKDDDSELADLTIITEMVADSVQAAMDQEAAHVIAGKFAGYTNGNGNVTLNLPASPTGNWSVTASTSAGGASLTVWVNGNVVTLWVYVPPASSLANTGVEIFWQAVAY